jgi:putative peptide zinc metalloprotease protein
MTTNTVDALATYVPVPARDVECLPLQDGGVHLRARSYVRLTPRQWQLWQMVDGERTLAEVATRFGSGRPGAYRVVVPFIQQMARLGFVSNYPDPAALRRPAVQTWRSPARWWKVFTGVIHPRLSFPVPTDLTRQLYERVFRPVCRREVALLVVLGALAAVVRYLAQVPLAEVRFWQVFEGTMRLGRWEFPRLIPTYLMVFLIASLHELGHAVSAARYGRPIREAGVGLIAIIFLATYVRMKDTWLLPTRQRLVVLVSGGLFSAATGALLFWAGVLGGASEMSLYLRDLGMFTLAATVINFYPFLFKSDGYYILEDIAGQPGLRAKAWRTVVNALRRRPVEADRRRRLWLAGFVCLQVLSYVLLVPVVRTLW